MSSALAARIEAAIAAWHRRREAAEVLPELALGLADPDARPLALRGFRLLGSAATAALPALTELLDGEPDEAAAAELAGTIASILPDHPMVLDRLIHGSSEIRLRLAKVLTAMGSAAVGAATALEVAATHDPEPFVRWHAAAALWSVAGRADIAFDILRPGPTREKLYDVHDHELIGASWPRLREMWPWFISVIVSIAAGDPEPMIAAMQG